VLLDSQARIVPGRVYCCLRQKRFPFRASLSRVLFAWASCWRGPSARRFSNIVIRSRREPGGSGQKSGHGDQVAPKGAGRRPDHDSTCSADSSIPHAGATYRGGNESERFPERFLNERFGFSVLAHSPVGAPTQPVQRRYLKRSKVEKNLLSNSTASPR
jgi:hypothetical protein